MSNHDKRLSVGEQQPPSTKHYFCFTIDTEPDDLWTSRGSCTFEHFSRLLSFHHELVDAGARPVYLTTSEVAEYVGSATVIGQILDTGKAELGAHFHTWTRDWPFQIPNLGHPCRRAMAHQLGQDVEEQMLRYTCNSLQKSFRVDPRSYRGGRWSLGSDSIKSLVNTGISIDTTVTPGRNWATVGTALESGPDYSEFPRSPFYLRQGCLEPASSGDVLELPVGACLHNPNRLVPRGGVEKIWRRLARMTGRQYGWLWLRPTLMSTRSLRTCLGSLRRDHVAVWVSMIHSSEIIPCPHLPTETHVRSFRQRCVQMVRDAVSLGANCATLAEVGECIGQLELISTS